MPFAQLVSQIINSKITSIEVRSCPNQYVGEISQFNKAHPDFPVRIPVANRPTDKPCLIMILESPHIEEFSGTAPCPANGKTGQRIREHLIKVVGSQYTNYGLALVNAIPYQCSLGKPTKCFRDDVFEVVWNNCGEGDFINELQGVYREGDVVVNCCTKGNSKEELRNMVQKAISTAHLNCTVLRRTHPVSWHSDKNRKFRWKK